MATNIDPVQTGVLQGAGTAGQRVGEFARSSSHDEEQSVAPHSVITSSDRPSKAGLQRSVSDVQKIVSSVTDNSLSFSVEESLNRMVVEVRVVGSDEIIRQFPPEEFLTVAKFIAAQDVADIDEDYLKGILFDQYS